MRARYGILVLPAALVGSVLAFLPHHDLDYWWHIALGRILSVHHAIPTTNPFLYTASPDAPVFVQPWIGLYWLYELHEMGGLATTLAIRNLLIAATVLGTALLRHGTNGNLRHATAAAGLVAVALAAIVPLGPAMFAPPLAWLAATACVLVHRAVLPRWSVMTLPLIAGFWANLEGGWWIPAVLAALFAASPTHRRWFAVAFAACALAPLLNPHGASIYAEGVTLTSGLVALVLLPALRSPEARAARPQPVTFAFADVAAAVALLLAAVLAQPWFVWNASINAALYGDRVRQVDPMRGIAPSELPVEALQILASWGSAPRIFHPRGLGGYVAFEAGTNRPAPILWDDPFPNIPGPEIDLLYEKLQHQPSDIWRGVFQQFQIRAAIVPRDWPLHDELTKSDWPLLWEGPHHSLFARGNPQNPPPNRK